MGYRPSASAIALPMSAGLIATVTPAWTARFEQPVQWERVTPMGQLVVATDCCLHGVDPSTGSVLWKRAGLTGLSDHSFETIPGTFTATCP